MIEDGEKYNPKRCDFGTKVLRKRGSTGDYIVLVTECFFQVTSTTCITVYSVHKKTVHVIGNEKNITKMETTLKRKYVSVPKM